MKPRFHLILSLYLFDFLGAAYITYLGRDRETGFLVFRTDLAADAMRGAGAVVIMVVDPVTTQNGVLLYLLEDEYTLEQAAQRRAILAEKLSERILTEELCDIGIQGIDLTATYFPHPANPGEYAVDAQLGNSRTGQSLTFDVRTWSPAPDGFRCEAIKCTTDRSVWLVRFSIVPMPSEEAPERVYGYWVIPRERLEEALF